MVNFLIKQSIISLYKCGKTQREIKETLHVGSDTVSTTIKEFNDNGFILKEDPPKKGPPFKRTNPTFLTFLMASTLANRKASAEEIAQKWNSENQNIFHISPTSVLRAKHDNQYSFKPPKIYQELSEQQIQKRKIFAISMLSANPNFDLFIFSDESRICLKPDNSFIWYKRGEMTDDVFNQYSKQELGVMVWAAIGIGYKSKLIFCNSNIDGYEYRRILRSSDMIKELNTLHGEGQWIFQQDGAPPHKCRMTQKFLLKHMNVVDNWPANSPDLNPIEHLWSILKRRIHKDSPQTMEEFKKKVLEEWENIPQNIIDNLVRSFKKRLLIAVEKEGKQIGHIPFSKAPTTFNYAAYYEPVNVISYHCPSINLDVERNKTPFTIEEDMLLLDLYKKLGPRWKQISKYFENRKNVDLRNRFIKLRGKGELKRDKQYDSVPTISESSDGEIDPSETHLLTEEPVVPIVTIMEDC